MRNRISLLAAALTAAVALPCFAEDGADAKAVFTEATKAMKALKAVSYTGEFKPEGAAVGQVPHVTGKVLQERGAKAGQMRFHVVGSFKGDDDKDTPFDVATDGKMGAAIDAKKKVVMQGKMPDAGAMFGPAVVLLMHRLGAEDPYEHEMDGELKVEKAETIAGVECDVISVKYEEDEAGSAKFFFGKKDHLPRRVDRMRGEGDDKGSVSFTAADFKADPTVPADAFAIKTPDGFSVKKFDGGRPSLIEEGEAAPDWTLKTPDGKEVSLKKDLAGKVVLMDFWATWCGPCKRAMPGVQKVFEHYKDNKNVAVYGIATWEKDGDPAKYMKDQKYTYGLLLKGDDVAKDYSVSGIPTFYIVGKDGKVFHASSGFKDGHDKELIELIDEALNAKPGDKPKEEKKSEGKNESDE